MQVSRTQSRALSSALGLLLLTAIALHIAALVMPSWMETKVTMYSTIHKAALQGDRIWNLTASEVLTTNQSELATYKGMRAGTFRMCYTLADDFEAPTVTTEQCFSYRSQASHIFVSRPMQSIYGMSMSMCQINDYSDASSTLEAWGIPPPYNMQQFLANYCSFQGYLTVIFQIGAIAATFIGVGAWLYLWCSPSEDQAKYLRTTTLAACVGALLTLATLVLWVGAFRDNFSSLGASAHCTIAAVVLSAAAAAVAFTLARREPSVKQQRVADALELERPTEPLV